VKICIKIKVAELGVMLYNARKHKKILTYQLGYDIVRKQSKRAFFLCLKKPNASLA
jgi:hypothetical protein